jgi:signal peptidase I
MGRGRAIAGAAAALGLLALLAIAGLMLLPPVFGYQRYVIEGGSMGGALPRGSIAYEEVVPAARIGVGDVITYRPPGRPSGRVTHRVVWTGRDASGARMYRTRGDLNRTRDPWTFTLAARTQARVVFHVPLAGYAVAALSVRAVRMLVLGLPALAIAAGAFRRAWRSARAPAPGSGDSAAQSFG